MLNDEWSKEGDGTKRQNKTKRKPNNNNKESQKNKSDSKNRINNYSVHIMNLVPILVTVLDKVVRGGLSGFFA